jgi:hypothetical protein
VSEIFMNATLRAPWMPAADSRESMILAFMTKHGRTSYENDIYAIHDDFYLVQAEAGPAHYLCPFVQEKLDRMNKEIEEIVQAAIDRYDDWATD